MAITRIKNNQITDLTVNAAAKLQDFSITSGKIANNLTYGSDLTITGNLTVQGNVTAIDTIDLVVEDPLIVLAKDQTGSPSLDIGYIGVRGTETNIAFVWDESADQFVAVFTDDEITNTTITINSYASLQVLDLTAANANITGNLTFNGSILGNVDVTGNITGGNLISLAAIDGVTITASGNLVGGNVTTVGNVDGANVNTTAGISAGTTIVATGNVSGGNVTTVGNVDGANINATANVTGTGAVFSGNVTAANFIGNIQGNIDAGGANTNIQFNDDDILNGSAAFTFDKTSNAVVATGNVTAGNIDTAGQVVATGNVSAGNLVSAADVTTLTVTATGNVSGGNLVTLGNIDGANVNATAGITAGTTIVATGNVSGGNVTTAGNVDGANINASSGITAGTTVMATGNVSGGNVTTVGNVDGANINASAGITAGTTVVATGNISGGNISTTGRLLTGTLETTGDSLIGGNLVVQGNLTFINVEDLRVEDPIIILGTGPNGAPLTVDDGKDRGVYMEYFDTVTANAFMGFQNASGNMIIANNVEFSGNDIVQINSFGNLNVGNLFPQSLNTGIGNVTAGNLNTSGQVIATGNVSGGNVTTAGNVDGANINASSGITAGTTIVATGNVSGGNVTTVGEVVATGNVIGGNLNTAGAVVATGNVSGGNVSAGTGIISTTGNIDGGNLNATANVTGTGAVFSGNVTAANFIGNIQGNIDAGGANTTIQFNDDDILNGSTAFTFDTSSNAVTATGNVTAGNIDTAGQVVATGNVSGGNVTTVGVVSATGNVIGGNLTTAGVVAATGNVSGGNITTVGNIDGANVNATGTVTATGNVTGGNLVTTGTADLGNIRITGDDITNFASNIITVNSAGADIDFRVSGDNETNLFIVDAGSDTVLIGTATPTTNAALKIGTTNSIMVPVGNTLQRPGVGVTGMVRFNTTSDSLEYYDNDSWTSAGTTFTIIVADSFNGDGSTVAFTLTEDSTTAGTIVSINGVVQIPTTAYSVSGNVLTFTEAPAVSDVIDARILTTTQTVIGIQNSSGNAVFEGSATEASFVTTGNIIPSANNIFNLGSAQVRWQDLYLAGNSLVLGNIVMKNTAGNTVGFFGPDGTTPATLDSNVEIVGDTIENGTSNVSFAGLNGNVLLASGGNITGVITATGANITGTLNSTGNANVGNLGTAGVVVATGNVSGGNITSAGNIDSASLNATSGITAGTTIVATGNVTGGNITTAGVVESTGNVIGANLNTGGVVIATGNITGGNLTTAGIVVATGNVTGGNLVTTGNIVAGNLIVTGIEAVTTLNVSGDTLISGNLTVSGNTITANVASIVVTDPILGLGRGANGDPLTSNDGLDRGIEMFYYTDAERIAFMGFDNNEGKMLSAANVSIANNIVTVNSYGTTVVGTLETAGIVNTNANGVGNIGSSTTFFNTVFAQATSAQYADLAEMYESDAEYGPGTVLCFGGAKEVTLCGQADSTRVAGVVSTNPSYLMNSGQTGEYVVPVALTGRVPCRVTGTIRKGDLIVSTGDGRACANNAAAVGTVIGKALSDFDGADGVIEVVVGRV